MDRTRPHLAFSGSVLRPDSGWRLGIGRIHAGRALVLAVTTIVVCACGSEQPVTPPGANLGLASGAYAAEAQRPEGRSAVEVAKAARGSLRCPVGTTLPARAQDRPVDDLMGIRPGMAYDEAANAILCTDELLVVGANERRGFDIRSHGTRLRQGFEIRPAQADAPMTQDAMMARMREQDRQRNNFVRVRDVPPGHSKWAVGTMGLQGQETVINVIREQWFESDRLPSATNVERALVEKYGSPSVRREYDGTTLLWAFDTLGRPVTETSRLHGQCELDHRIDGMLKLKADCGLTIAAKLNPPRDNELLVEFLEIHIVDQAKAFAAIERTERDLLALSEARKASELERAGEQADEVAL